MEMKYSPGHHGYQFDGSFTLVCRGVRNFHGEPLPQHLYNAVVDLS